MAEFRIVVVVDPSGARSGTRQVQRSFKRIEASADRMGRLIRRALAFGAAAIGIRQLTELANTFVNVQNRLKLVTEGTAQLNVVMEELFNIANRTRGAFQGTADLFARVALASAELGVSRQEILNFTESVSQAIILSGASAREANAGLIQLAQGIASARLGGDELRSVLEQLPAVADVIARSMGRARGELRALGAEGKITPEIVLKAFREAREELTERFAKTIPTIGQAFTVLRNNVIQLIGRIDEGSGALLSIANFIIGVGDNLETLARVIAAVGIAFAVKFAKDGVLVAVRALQLLAIALVANPLGAIITIIIAATAAFIAFGDQIKVGEGRLANLQDFAIAVFEKIRKAIDVVVVFFETNFGFIADFASDVFGEVSLSIEGILTVGARTVDTLVGMFKGAADAIVIAFKDVPRLLEKVFVTAFNTVSRLTVLFLNSVIEGLNLVLGALDLVLIDALGTAEFTVIPRAESLGNSMMQAIADGIRASTAAQDALAEILARAEVIAADRIKREEERRAALEKARQELLKADDPVNRPDRRFAKILEQLQDEERLLRLTNKEREIQQGLLDAARELTKDLNVAQELLVDSQLRTNQALQDERDALDEIRGPIDDLLRGTEALNRLFDRGAIKSVEFAGALRTLRIASLESARDMESGFVRALLKIEDEFADLAQVSEALLVNAFQGMEDALVQFVTTGKLGFADLIDSILADLVRLSVRQSITGPLASALTGGEGGGLVGRFFSSFLPGFQHGGSFRVGGRPGVDHNVLSLNGQPVARVSQGETVGVSPSRGGGTLVQIVDQRGADSPPVELGESSGPSGERVLTVFIRDATRQLISDGSMDRTLDNRFGLRPSLRGR